MTRSNQNYMRYNMILQHRMRIVNKNMPGNLTRQDYFPF